MPRLLSCVAGVCCLVLGCKPSAKARDENRPAAPSTSASARSEAPEETELKPGEFEVEFDGRLDESLRAEKYRVLVTREACVPERLGALDILGRGNIDKDSPKKFFAVEAVIREGDAVHFCALALDAEDRLVGLGGHPGNPLRPVATPGEHDVSYGGLRLSLKRLPRPVPLPAGRF